MSLLQNRRNARWQFLKEPFLHFILLGLIIYFIADYIKARNDRNRFAITMADEDVLRIAALWEKQYGTLPSKNELNNLVDNHIREEIFYREGVALGLDKEDEVIRRRIAQKYEFLQQDLTIPGEPTESDLASYFEKNKARYRVAEKISFTHIFFSPDKAGDADAISRAQHARTILESKKSRAHRKKETTFRFSYDYADVNATELVRLLGDSPLSQAAFSVSTKQWSQPLQSGYGYHLLYITEKTAAAIPEYNTIKEEVRRDYLEEIKVFKNEEAYQALLKRYSVTKPEIHELNP